MPYVTDPKWYFYYVLFSTTCRNFESGLVAALMADIKEDLGMSYTLEGVVVSSSTPASLPHQRDECVAA